MASSSETTFNGYTFTHQWTVNHLRARLCHPGELKSGTFDSPEGAKPATKWQLVLYKEQGRDHQRSATASTSDREEYFSLRLDRLIRTQLSRSKNKKALPVSLPTYGGSCRSMPHYTAQHVQSLPQFSTPVGVEQPREESEIWVEAHLTPTIIYKDKRETLASQAAGPRQVSSNMDAEVNMIVYDAATFKQSLSMSRLHHSLRVTFDCEIHVWLLDDPVHVHQPIIHVPEFNIGKLMEENRRKNLFTDVTLVAADKKEFKAHKLILAAQSNFFKTRFSSRWQDQRKGDKVELTDVPGNVMEVMLSYMYTGEVAAIEKVATSVLPFAEEYGLEGLRKMCEQSLAKSLTSDNAVDLLITANAHNALDLKKVCMDYISSNVVSVRKSEGWRKLKEEKTCRDLWVEVLEKVAESHDHDGATTSSTNHSSDWTEVNQLPVPSFNTW